MASSHTAVNADDVLALLIQDRINGDDRFTGHPVSNDELPLPLTLGKNGVENLGTGV